MHPRNPHTADPASSDPFDHAGQELDRALARLGDVDRTVVTLRYLQSRPLREVAEMMGMSEPAVTKRAARALAKLRNMLVRRGVQASPALLLDVLDRASRVLAPPHVAANAAQASAASGATAGAAAMARAALRKAVWRARAGKAALLLLAAALLGGTVSAVSSLRSHTSQVRVDLPAAPVVAARIKVGVYLSKSTAVSLAPSGKPQGFGEQMILMPELNADSDDLELFPLIEPGTDRDPEVSAQLAQHFPGRPVLDVTSADSLSRVDVILCCAMCAPTEDALAAIDASVRGGRGLYIRQCLGNHHAGFGRSSILRLRSIAEADPRGLIAPAGTKTNILAAHPLLGTLSGKIGKTVTTSATSAAAYGVLEPNATPLIQVGQVQKLHHLSDDGDRAIQTRPGYGCYPLVVASLGRGHVVDCGFFATRLPVALDRATDGKFNLRCIRWAAGRPVE